MLFRKKRDLFYEASCLLDFLDRCDDLYKKLQEKPISGVVEANMISLKNISTAVNLLSCDLLSKIKENKK